MKKSVATKTPPRVVPTKEEMDTFLENYRQEVKKFVVGLSKRCQEAPQFSSQVFQVGSGFVCFAPEAYYALGFEESEEHGKLLAEVMKDAIRGFAVVREPDITIRYDPAHGSIHTTVSIVCKV